MPGISALSHWNGTFGPAQEWRFMVNLGQKVKHQVFSFEVRRVSGSKCKPVVQVPSLGTRIFLLVETPKERRKWDESKGAGEAFFSPPGSSAVSFFHSSTYPKGRYFYSPQCSSVIKMMAATTILTKTSSFSPAENMSAVQASWCRVSANHVLVLFWRQCRFLYWPFLYFTEEWIRIRPTSKKSPCPFSHDPVSRLTLSSDQDLLINITYSKLISLYCTRSSIVDLKEQIKKLNQAKSECERLLPNMRVISAKG